MPRYQHNLGCRKSDMLEWFTSKDDDAPRIHGWLCRSCGRLTIERAEIETEEMDLSSKDTEQSEVIDNTHPQL